ncbi:hypothetical protein [Aurantibacillus circumpalustris]|uniref:hypothetical protein n=1 Tax=Aurantibacillus circumpalustris TaxID=3036359 RepID=UPI00295B531B|nr:hypothetical protein [Aurantibacillus circumpalustris]
MKKIVLVFSFAGLKLVAQDTLIFKNQTKLISLVLWVGEDSIRYKNIENITGPDLYARNSEIHLVKYRNGRVENIDSLQIRNTSLKNLQKQTESLQSKAESNSVQMYKNGTFHAEVNYKCKGCKVGFFSLGLLLGPIAVIPAFSTAYILPSDKKLAYPSEELWQNKDYQKGYKDKASAIKRRAIFGGTSAGAILSTFTTAVLINILTKR